MALPTSRNTTYAPTSMVKSVDLNDIQDCITGGKHGYVWQPIEPLQSATATGGSPSFTGSDTVQRWSLGANGAITLRIPVRNGATWRGIRARVEATNDIAVVVRSFIDGDYDADIDSQTHSVAAAETIAAGSTSTGSAPTAFDTAVPFGTVLTVEVTNVGGNPAFVYELEYLSSAS